MCGGLAVLLLATACGGGGKTSVPTPTTLSKRPIAATPTLSLDPTKAALTTALAGLVRITPPPTPTPLIVGPDVRLCHRTDIATAVSSNALTGGQLLADIVLGNRSATACKIGRMPEVQFLDLRGQQLPITVSPDVGCSACIFQQPLLLLPNLGAPKSHVAVRPGQVVLRLTWHIHNGAGTCPTPPPKAMEVGLLLQDTEQEVVVDVTSELPDGIAPCDGTVQIFGYGPGTGG
jgi:hypothetical protein